MPQHEPVTVLLVNDVGEEIKLVTLSFRGFFPGCRVDAVYSLDEALQWAPKADWHLMLIDEQLIAKRNTPTLPELKRLAPRATLVLQTDRSDASAAVNALQAGADFLLYKKSPAFLTELMLYAKGALETRQLRLALDRTQERHGRLVDTLGDVLYELDAEGRFVYLSPSITGLLGFAPEELTGAHYSAVIPADQMDRARHRLNDRRTGARASRRIEVELASKTPHGGRPGRVRTELSAKGLYDPQRHYLGTLGLLRDISQRREQEDRIHRLEQQLRNTDHVVQLAQRLSGLSKQLQAPLAAVLSQSHQLLGAIQEARLDQQVESLLRHATEAVRQGEELAQTMRDAAPHDKTVNDILDTVLATTVPPLLNTESIERRYAQNLPVFSGNVEHLSQLLRALVSHAQRYVAAVGSQHRLRITSVPLDPAGTPTEPTPTLFPPIQPVAVNVHIEETEFVVAHPQPPLEETMDLFQAYALVQQLGGRLDFLAPAGGLLSITVHLPVSSEPAEPSHESPSPVSNTPVPSAAVVDAPIELPSIPPVHPISPLPDRRGKPRISVHLPAKMTIGNTTREGTVVTLGLGGAGVVVEGQLPSFEGQPAYVILRTAAGMLELHATTHDRVSVSEHTTTPAPTSLLALRFAPAGDGEQKVLTSLIEEANERTLPLTLEALLSLPEDTPAAPQGGSEARGRDHREALRVRMALPARLEMAHLDVTAQRPLALMINLSRGGACLQMKEVPGAVGDMLSLHFSATGSLGHPRTHEPEAPEAVLTARIVWTAPDHSAPSELRPGPSDPGRRIGIRFVQSTPFAEREVNRVVAQHVGSSMDLEGIASRSSIVSARRECRNARHQIIAMTDDHARHQISPATPIVIVVPGFGKMQSDYLPLSFFLAANRLRVLRYDHSNHVGQSDGDVLQTTLRGMQVDLQQVLEFASTTWPTAPLAIVAEDIGARVALKVVAKTELSASLLLVNPVLDLQRALTAAYQHDVLTDHRQGVRRGAANLWGLNVSLDQFLGDTLAGDYAFLTGSADDIAALRTPVLIAATPDPSEPARDQLGASLRALGRSPEVVSLPTEIAPDNFSPDERHTATFQVLYRHIAAFVHEQPPAEMRDASQRDVHRQRQLEHERTRIRHHVSQATRDALWIAHVAQLSQLGNLHDHRLLGEDLYRHLLPLSPDTTILDMGCGQGDLARVILTNQAYAASHRSGLIRRPLRYVGLGQSRESVTTADRSVAAFQREVASTFATVTPGAGMLDMQWMPFGWDSALPFADGAFMRIVCHLSLSFSPSPLDALRHALRVLSPEGRLIITCYQPGTDVASVYRRHLHTAGQDGFTAPGQIVLHYLGRIREAIRHGLLHSYEREDLGRLLIHAGGTPIQIRPVLGGHLLMAVAVKGKSAG